MTENEMNLEISIDSLKKSNFWKSYASDILDNISVCILSLFH